MFLRDAKNAIPDQERENELCSRTEALAVTGPFTTRLFVERPHDTASPRETIAAASIDDIRKNRLIILDPRVFSLLNGADTNTRHAIRAAMGLGNNKLAVNWASSAVFAVVNTHRRRNALIAAGNYLAAKRVASREAVKNDPDLKAQASDELTSATKDFDKQVRAAYQHVVWLADTGNGQRDWSDHRFEGDLETALNGSHIWKVLEAAEKAFGIGEFNAKALCHNLEDRDYGKPLTELRDDFWRIPRLPLLPNGEHDLRRAVWEAIQAGDLIILDSEGPRAVHSISHINLASDIQRLGRKAVEQSTKPTDHTEDDSPGSENGKDPEPAEEKRVTVSTTLPVNATNRDALRVVLDALRNSVEDGTISWLQVSVQATMTPDAANDLRTKAEISGMHTTVTNL